MLVEVQLENRVKEPRKSVMKLQRKYYTIYPRNSAVDKYMGDQIIPYMALAGNSRIKTAELTQHTLTNIYVTEKFIDKKFHVEGSLG